MLTILGVLGWIVALALAMVCWQHRCPVASPQVSLHRHVTIPQTRRVRHPLDTWSARLVSDDLEMETRHGRGRPPETIDRPHGRYRQTGQDPEDPTVYVYRREA